VLVPRLHVQSTSEEDLGCNVEQRARGIAEDRRPLGVAQAWGAENVLHGCARPRIREIGAHHDLAGATFRHQMPEGLRGEDDRVVIEIP